MKKHLFGILFLSTSLMAMETDQPPSSYLSTTLTKKGKRGGEIRCDAACTQAVKNHLRGPHSNTEFPGQKNKFDITDNIPYINELSLYSLNPNDPIPDLNELSNLQKLKVTLKDPVMKMPRTDMKEDINYSQKLFVSTLRLLDLSNSKFISFPDLTNLTKLEEVIFSRSNIETLEGKKLPSSLKILRFQKSVLKKFSETDHLNNLNTIDLSETRILDGAVKNLPLELKILDLYECRPNQIDLRYLLNLQEIKLSYVIDPKILPQNIKKITFHTEFQKTPDLSGFKELKELNLSYNNTMNFRYEYVKEDKIETLKKKEETLQTSNASEITFLEIIPPNDEFDQCQECHDPKELSGIYNYHHSGSKSLSLSSVPSCLLLNDPSEDINKPRITIPVFPSFHFDFQKIPQNIQSLTITSRYLINMPDLSHLNIQYLNLCETPKLLLDTSRLPQKNLRVLILDSNEFIILPNLTPLANLEELSVNKNKGLKFNNETKLPESLKILLLDFNDFQEIPNLSSLKNLKELSLKGNKLINITLKNLPGSLESLDLSENLLQQIPDISLLSSLKNLNLAGNQIRHLDEVSLIASIEKLELENNKNLQFSSLLKLKKLKYLSFSYFMDFSPSFLPKNLKDLSVLKQDNKECVLNLLDFSPNVELDTDITRFIINPGKQSELKEKLLKKYPYSILIDSTKRGGKDLEKIWSINLDKISLGLSINEKAMKALENKGLNQAIDLNPQIIRYYQKILFSYMLDQHKAITKAVKVSEFSPKYKVNYDFVQRDPYAFSNLLDVKGHLPVNYQEFLNLKERYTKLNSDYAKFCCDESLRSSRAKAEEKKEEKEREQAFKKAEEEALKIYKSIIAEPLGYGGILKNTNKNIKSQNELSKVLRMIVYILESYQNDYQKGPYSQLLQSKFYDCGLGGLNEFLPALTPCLLNIIYDLEVFGKFKEIILEEDTTGLTDHDLSVQILQKLDNKLFSIYPLLSPVFQERKLFTIQGVAQRVITGDHHDRATVAGRVNLLGPHLGIPSPGREIYMALMLDRSLPESFNVFFNEWTLKHLIQLTQETIRKIQVIKNDLQEKKNSEILFSIKQILDQDNEKNEGNLETYYQWIEGEEKVDEPEFFKPVSLHLEPRGAACLLQKLGYIIEDKEE